MKRLHRMTGVLIISTTAAMALFLWFVLAEAQAWTASEPREALIGGGLSVLYDPQAPQLGFVLAAVVLVLLVTAGVALFDLRATNRSRRSSDESALPWHPGSSWLRHAESSTVP